MAERSHEGPMDFEYTDGTGPMDARSPFAQLSMNQQRSTTSNGGGPTAGSKKRGLFAAFQSPSKSSFPTLREPNSQAHLFSQPPTPFSATTKLSHFATPRKLDLDIASSGGETPQSPEHTLIDSDATPDNSNNTLNFRGTAAKFDQASMPSFTAGPSEPLPSPSKRAPRRESWFSRGLEYLSNSPGRAPIVSRGGGAGVYSDKLAKRVRKKRAREAHRHEVRLRDESMSDSETNDDRRVASPRKTSRTSRTADDENSTQSKGYAQSISSFLEFLTKHPTLPTILSWYAQLTLNVFVFTGIMFVLWSFWSTIRSDVDKKSSEAVAELLTEMGVCVAQYQENKCEPGSRVPAMEVVCTNWEKCMNRDAMSVGRARLSAHTFAEIFNSFLEPISYKAMIFSLVLVFGCVALSNLPFSMFRDRAAAAAASQQQAAQNHHHYYPPPTPSRQISGQMDQWNHMRYDQATIEPAPTPGLSRYGHIEERGSPVKALKFR